MTGAPDDPSAGSLDALTPREREILELIAQGLANKTAAAELSITEQTVKAHAKQIYRKLRVTSRVQAMLMYHGLLPPKSNGQDEADGGS